MTDHHQTPDEFRARMDAAQTQADLQDAQREARTAEAKAGKARAALHEIAGLLESYDSEGRSAQSTMREIREAVGRGLGL